jgi:hypothetical protein
MIFQLDLLYCNPCFDTTCSNSTTSDWELASRRQNISIGSSIKHQLLPSIQNFLVPKLDHYSIHLKQILE